MPQFVVTKAQDAHVLFEKVFEADSIEHANQLADADRFNSEGWEAMQETRFYDDMKILTDETVEHEPEQIREPLYVTQAEKDQILAGLRAYQALHDMTAGEVPAEIQEIATNGDQHEAMTFAAIDALAERINCE